MGFWQSKMRYRSSDELADIAVQFATRKIPLDVLVIGENQSHRLD
jgi:alpha-glucosidase (family GH31 glycosyl hydrolase)